MTIIKEMTTGLDAGGEKYITLKGKESCYSHENHYEASSKSKEENWIHVIQLHHSWEMPKNRRLYHRNTHVVMCITTHLTRAKKRNQCQSTHE